MCHMYMEYLNKRRLIKLNYFNLNYNIFITYYKYKYIY